MRIVVGGTRVVFITNDHAYKIAIPFQLFVVRGLKIALSRKKRRHVIQKYPHPVSGILLRGIFAGLVDNRNEHRYYCASKDPRVMPVTKKLFWGFVIAQEKGLPVSPRELIREDRLHALAGRDCDLHDQSQFCRTRRDGRIVVVDYGKTLAIEFLMSLPAMERPS